MFKLSSRSQFISSYQAGTRDFKHTILTGVNLSGNNLMQVNLDESSLVEVDWRNCNLSQASLRRAYLGLSNFQNCCLRYVNLEEANLAEANLKQANLKGANLKGVKLKNTCLKGAVYDSKTAFDSDLQPQKLGMILSDSSSFDIKSKQTRGTIQKIWSWCIS